MVRTAVYVDGHGMLETEQPPMSSGIPTDGDLLDYLEEYEDTEGIQSRDELLVRCFKLQRRLGTPYTKVVVRGSWRAVPWVKEEVY